MKFIEENISFHAHGVAIAGILRRPAGGTGKLPAIVCTHPTSSCKEQTVSIYAAKLAEAGFVTLVFDASFQGESGGTPRYIEIPEYRVDDIRGGVDYLSSLDFVDRERIGAFGVCAGGGYSVNAAMTDRRIRAVGSVVGVNLGRLYRDMNAWETLDTIAAQRNAQVDGGAARIITWLPKTPAEAEAAGIKDIDVLEAVDYYCTPRGQHPNSPNKVDVVSFASIIGFDAFRCADRFLTQPLQIIIGEKQGGFGSYRDGQELYSLAASEKKDLFIVKDTSHYELYDKPEAVAIASEKLIAFYNENL